MTIESPNSADLEALALARRSGWPEDLRVLVARYPREQWDAHPNLGEMARFWMSRHAMFRELSTAIEQIAALFCAGRIPPQEFARQFVPRLQFMLDQLNVHHQIEDLHYFPIFRAADERLARGFDVLQGDHHHIHADMARTAETANALLENLCQIVLGARFAFCGLCRDEVVLLDELLGAVDFQQRIAPLDLIAELGD